MTQNYTKIALRALRHNRGFAWLNVGGLALGLLCCGFIALFVRRETAYDRWIPGGGQVYRVSGEIQNFRDGKTLLFAPGSGPLAAALLEFPSVAAATRCVQPFERSLLVSDGAQKAFYEQGCCVADANFFDIFPYPFVEGDPKTALQAPDAVVVSEKAGRKYFGTAQGILGKTIHIGEKPRRVAGVLRDLPEGTSIAADFIMAMGELANSRLAQNWHSNVFHTFLRLRPDADVAALNAQIEKIADRYVGEEIKQHQQSYRYYLQPLHSIHLDSNLRYEWSANGSRAQVNLVMGIGLFVLALAAVNFVNLATARARSRAKEVGVRKAIGAGRSTLMRQFMIESMAACGAAWLLSLVGMTFALPAFNRLADLNLTLRELWNPVFLALSFAGAALTSLAAGLYPALALSAFRPDEALRPGGTARQDAAGKLTRKPLVVGQFAVSVALLAATFVVFQQLEYWKSQNLGFNQSQLLVLRAKSGDFLEKNYKTVRAELARTPGVEAIGVSGRVPGETLGNNLITLESDETKATDMLLFQMDEQYLATLGVPVVAGRGLSETNPVDLEGDHVLINEAALPFFGWKVPEEALGKTFGGGWGTVVGVVQDFHFNSLRQRVVPVMFYFRPRSFEHLSLRIAAGVKPSELLARLEKTWHSVAPNRPFDFFFQDEHFQRQYRAEERLGRLLGGFAGLALVIACLGLLGLAAFAAEQRRKEIGIRKVLGASVGSVVGLLSKDFLILVLLALVAGAPLAYWAMHRWLQDFAYRVEIGWPVFALAGGVALVVAFLAVSSQAIGAALANPVKSLRSE